MKTNESGRSMVEMLGVLAIIGVLSIGGIAGYTTAMNRYRANEVIDMATKYATVAFTTLQSYGAMNSGAAPSLANIPTFDKTGLSASATISGASIGQAKPIKLTCTTTSGAVTCTENNVLGTGTALNAGEYNAVKIELIFTDAENVCKAAASALGYKSTENAKGYADCDNNKIYFVTRQS